ncbi:MAG: hypothetical protein IVW57_02600 [Ktedonobacterales bacterium]|nr:hypothetical protein [Ktedonobacterales bacterium]
METRILPGRLWRESEFVGGLTGACGPNALSMAESWALQRYVSTLAVYQRMRAAGRADANGTSNASGLYAQAVADGFATALLPYREPMPEADWRGFFSTHVGVRAVVIELANGQALVDRLSGKGENARNLKYHFIVVVGWHAGGYSARAARALPPGWWCADGDNFAAGDVLQFYPEAVLVAARPCATLAIAARTTGTSGSGGGGGASVTGDFERLPDGRGKDTRTGELLGAGFLDYCLAHDVRQKCVKGETEVYPGVSAAFFDGGLILYYKVGGAVSDALGGYLAMGLLDERNDERARLTTAQADLATATRQRDTATTQVAALTAQLADVRAQLANLQQQQQQGTPGAESAQALVKALKAALA